MSKHPRHSTAQQDVLSEHAPASSLAATCSKTITTAPLNTAELENLPQHMLVQLLGQVVAERDEAQTQVKMRDEEVKQLKQKEQDRYFVDPCYVSDRVDCDPWEERIQNVLAKWEPRTSKEGWTAHNSHYNYKPKLLYDKETKCFGFRSYWDDDTKQYEFDMYRVMSSALLLYRVCCLFAGIHIDVMGRDAYKVVWQAEVKHKATGEAMGFSEWKGAALVRVSNITAPEEFESDMLELLNLLFDTNFPHPYDGTVAGCVA